MNILMLTYGTLLSAVDAQGAPYNDWRCLYLDRPGLIILYDCGMSGKRIIWLYPYAPDEAEQPYFHTSPGELDKEDDRFIIKTENSTYEFRENEGCLTEEEKSRLFSEICAILKPIDDISGAEEN